MLWYRLDDERSGSTRRSGISLERGPGSKLLMRGCRAAPRARVSRWIEPRIDPALVRQRQASEGDPTGDLVSRRPRGSTFHVWGPAAEILSVPCCSSLSGARCDEALSRRICTPAG